jgi:hypothetical protein
MTKPWLVVTAETLAAIPPATGVFELRRSDGEVIDIGYAGGRDLFGLRSRISAAAESPGHIDLQMRYEIHVQYLSRYVELVLAHRATHGGSIPEIVGKRPIAVRGRLSI